MGQHLDAQRVLIAGFSGGASTAPYEATNRPGYSRFAVLLGGVFAGGFGSNRIPGWLSTGTNDALRTPALVRQAASEVARAGFGDVVFREFPGGHALSELEVNALVQWWLGAAATQ